MHPVLLRLGGLEIRSYGVMLAAAFLVGTWYLLRRVRRKGVMTEEQVYELAIYLVLGAVVGARLAYVVLFWDYYRLNPGAAFRVWEEGGLTFYGGLLVDLLIALLFLRRHRIPLGEAFDLGAPAIALGYAVARLGCFLNGCCYGHFTSLPWGVDFGDGPRHPTQLYAALASLLIFFLLRRQEERKPFPGYLFLLYLSLYALYRFLVEFWRESPLVFSWLTQGQLASLFLGLAAFSLLLFCWRRTKKA